MKAKTEMDFFHILTKAHEQTNKYLNKFYKEKPHVHMSEMPMQCPIFHSTLTKSLKLPRSTTEFINDSSKRETDKEKEENRSNTENEKAFNLPAVKVEHDRKEMTEDGNKEKLVDMENIDLRMNHQNADRAVNNVTLTSTPLSDSSGFMKMKAEAQKKELKNEDWFQYNMSHKRRGFHLIFANQYFDNTLIPSRHGTDVDVTALTTAYDHLGFENCIYRDLSFIEISDILNSFSEMDHSDSDCIAITVVTHGSNGVLHARDHPYNVENIWQPFEADKCPSLAGKPKLFVIQACQGENIDSGVEIKLFSDAAASGSHMPYTAVSEATSFRIPTQSDFIWGYSSLNGHVSWRNRTTGAYYIQALCNVILQSVNTEDYSSMLSKAIQRTIVMLNKYTSQDITTDRIKMQCPNFCSTLRGKVIFQERRMISDPITERSIIIDKRRQTKGKMKKNFWTRLLSRHNPGNKG